MPTIRNGLFALFLLLLSGCSDSSKSASSPPKPNYMPKDSWEGDTPFILPGLKQPPTVAADATELGEEEPVIGVSAGTKYRAYSLKAMTHVASHVINDALDGVPVTVTYCDRTDTGRCFTRSGTKWPLELQLGGWKDQKVLLKLQNRFYAHDATDIPLADYQFEKTTWGAWRQEHPDTDVYETPPAYPGAEAPPMKKMKPSKKTDEKVPDAEMPTEENKEKSENTDNNDGK